jgi:hypothetical protein
MTGKPDHVYVTYVGSTPEAVWDALTDADPTVAPWGTATCPTGGRAPAGNTPARTVPASRTWSGRSWWPNARPGS